jgi:preprotein translocase subunit SecY
MNFFKDFIRNLLILAVIFIVLLIAAPDFMSQVYGLLGGLFGPLLILIVVVAALPKRRR